MTSSPSRVEAVHVYYTRIGEQQDPATLVSWDAILSPAERARAARFRRPADRETYVAAHAMLRAALSLHAPAHAADWQFETGTHGRPAIVGPPAGSGLHFSLSHTSDFAVCAVAHGTLVGVDVESPQARAHVEIAERCFAPAERAEMASHSADLQGDRFLEYWTLKESFLKALGLGLSYPPSSICFSLGPDEIRLVAPPELKEPTEAWRFESWLHEDRYRIALAMRSEGRNVPIVMSPWTGGVGS